MDRGTVSIELRGEWNLERMPFIIGAMALMIGCAPALGEWTTQLYDNHVFVANSETPYVPESSGVVASRKNPYLYWTHGDAGTTQARVWAFRLSPEDKAVGVARHLGYVDLTGASNTDWEDIASGPNNTIYLFDGGDNPPCGRTGKRIHRFYEPTIDPNGPPVALACLFDSIRFEYPSAASPQMPASANEDRYDAECLMVHPNSGDIYVVTKRTTDKQGKALVFKLPSSAIEWNSSRIHVLQYVTDLTPKVSSPSSTMVTGGDIHAEGERLVIRTYACAYEFLLPQGLPFDAIFQQNPETHSMLSELAFDQLRGEGICYSYFDGSLITTTESLGASNFRVFATPWLFANLRVETVTDTTARVCWDTPQPTGASVDFGTTTAYGQKAVDPILTTTHAVTLTGLTPGQTYYYRASSGALTFPDASHAGWFSFLARFLVPADFDRDGDVDLDDFAHLQRCLRGPGVVPDDPACKDARLDDDEDVDVADLRLLQDCLSGPGFAPEPDCMTQ